jgi:hypothetical protein
MAAGEVILLIKELKISLKPKLSTPLQHRTSSGIK